MFMFAFFCTERRPGLGKKLLDYHHNRTLRPRVKGKFSANFFPLNFSFRKMTPQNRPFLANFWVGPWAQRMGAGILLARTVS